MTVVVVRDGVMAADTGARTGQMKRFVTKLHRVDKAIIGFSGSLLDGLVFVDWWREGRNMDHLPEFRMYRGADDAPDITALVLTPDGLEYWTEHFQPSPVEMPYFAVGSGAMAAMGAMHMGADAIRAAEAACAIADGCDLPVRHEEIG